MTTINNSNIPNVNQGISEQNQSIDSSNAVSNTTAMRKPNQLLATKVVMLQLKHAEKAKAQADLIIKSMEDANENANKCSEMINKLNAVKGNITKDGSLSIPDDVINFCRNMKPNPIEIPKYFTSADVKENDKIGPKGETTLAKARQLEAACKFLTEKNYDHSDKTYTIDGVKVTMTYEMAKQIVYEFEHGPNEGKGFYYYNKGLKLHMFAHALRDVTAKEARDAMKKALNDYKNKIKKDGLEGYEKKPCTAWNSAQIALAIENITNCRQNFTSNSQTQYTKVQDFTGQYNSYLQAANQTINNLGNYLSGLFSR